MAIRQSISNFVQNLIRDEEPNYEGEFIYFWHESQQEKEIEVVEKETISKRLKDNQLITLTSVGILFATFPLIFSLLNIEIGTIISTIILILFLLIAHLLNSNKYTRIVEILDNKINKLHENNLQQEESFLAGYSDNETVRKLDQVRVDLNQKFNAIDSKIRDINFQLNLIERNFARTSNSLGSANISMDRSIANVAVYQEFKGYISLSSNGVDALTASFDESINVTYSMIKLLKSLGKQIQMLALNAGIEASRSEEYGVGFEVVASNLRRLSNHVTDSAGDVKNQLSDISEKARQEIEVITNSMQSIFSRIENSHETITGVSNEIQDSSQQFNSVQSNYDKLLEYINEVEDIINNFKL